MIRSKMFALVLAGLALAGYPGAPGAQTALPAELVAVRAAPRMLELRLVGTVEAANSYPGAFRSSGRILEIGFETGDRVAAGAVIARIDSAQAEAALAGARATVDAAQASLLQAEQARERAENLLERGVGTRAQLDSAQEAFLAARASLDQATARLEAAEQAVEDTVIRAEEDVIVLDRFAHPGEIVGAGQEIVRLASDGQLEALFQSPDLPGLSKLRQSELVLFHDDGPAFPSSVSEISPVVTDTGTVEVRAEIPDALAAELNIGSVLEGRVIRKTDPVFTVPWTALAATRAGPAVWVVDPDTMAVHLTQVTIARYDDDGIDLSEGLTDGMRVVGAGSQSLYEGAVVKQAGTVQ